MKNQSGKMIKFYQYNLGNNRLVGNEQTGGYTDEVPKWYKLQADVYSEHHQLAGQEEPEEKEEKEGKAEKSGGSTFWSDSDFEASERMKEDDWGKFVSEHDIYLPSQAQSNIEELKKQGLI